MVAALDLGSSDRNGRKSSSLFVGTMLMWAQVAKGNDCKSYDIFPPGVRFPPSALMNLYGTVAQLVERQVEALRRREFNSLRSHYLEVSHNWLLALLGKERGGVNSLHGGSSPPISANFGSVDLIGKAPGPNPVVRKFLMQVQVLPFPRNFWRIRLIGKSAVLKTAVGNYLGVRVPHPPRILWRGTLIGKRTVC